MKYYWFIFSGNEIWLHDTENADKLSVPYQEESPTGEAGIFEFRTADGIPCKALSTDRRKAAAGFRLTDLRASFHLLPETLYLAAGKAFELLYWERNTRFCPTCGTPLAPLTEISKKCPQCGRECWPTVSTAIIVLVRRGDQALLVQAKNFRGDYLGLVAGFVETGETLEECVRREVMEETGIRIDRIRYFASQPWPYPCGLMVGFTAEYAGGELVLQQSELNKGGWYDKDNLPAIPGKMSMARMLLDAWTEGRLPKA